MDLDVGNPHPQEKKKVKAINMDSIQGTIRAQMGI